MHGVGRGRSLGGKVAWEARGWNKFTGHEVAAVWEAWGTERKGES